MSCVPYNIADYKKSNKDFSASINDSLTRLINLDRSYTSTTSKLTLTDYDFFLNDIKNYVLKCSKPNWGGDDEDAFSDKTKNNIRIFTELTRDFIEKVPDVTATNDGQLSLEWIGPKYESILRINQFGIAFIKTVKDILNDGENEIQMVVSFTQSHEELRRSVYKIMKFVNDEDTL